MAMGISPTADKRFLDRLITVEWMMKILWETYDFNDGKIRSAIKKYYLYDSATWKDYEKDPAQALSVIMAFLRVFTRDYKILEEMVDTFAEEGIREAYKKAQPYFEYLKRAHGDLVWFNEVSLV